MASGNFILRLPAELHAALRDAAAAADLSLNEYCRRRLAAPASALEHGPGAGVAQLALELHGDDLLGLVVFGSWARGEAGAGSDVDVLVVLHDRRSLVRSLYRAWDERPATWAGHELQVHLVHLPEPGRAGSVWAEAALDGVVLLERELEVSRALAAIRRDIASGRLVRRVVHGQPYWAEVA